MNFNKIIVLLLVSFMAHAALAQTPINTFPFCKLNGEEFAKGKPNDPNDPDHFRVMNVRKKSLLTSWIPSIPSWFTKPLGKGDQAFYIDESNHLLTLRSNDANTRVIDVPGTIDPVPSYDGYIMTTPDEGMTLYWMDDVKTKGTNAEPLIADPENDGVYQSVALIKENGNKRTYRIVSEMSVEVAFTDYEVDLVQKKAKKVRNVTHACPGKNLKTMIISKRGTYLTAYDANVGTTKIFDISKADQNVPDNQKCVEVLDMGYPTGKMDFNVKEDKVTFHVEYFDSKKGEYFSGVDPTFTKDVFVMDVEKIANGKLRGKNLRRLTTSLKKGNGAYYPSFLVDPQNPNVEKVLYVSDEEDTYSFELADISKYYGFDFYLPPAEWRPNQPMPEGAPQDWTARLHRASAIGGLWSKLCSNYDEEITAVAAASIFMSIEPAACKQMISEHWDANNGVNKKHVVNHVRLTRDLRFDKNIIAGYKASDLLQSCKDSFPDQNFQTEIFGERKVVELDGEGTMGYYCTGCHAGNGALRLSDGTQRPNLMNFDNLNLAQVLESIRRINKPFVPTSSPDAFKAADRMPPGNGRFAGDESPNATVQHRRVALEYLEDLRKSLETTRPPINP